MFKYFRLLLIRDYELFSFRLYFKPKIYSIDLFFRPFLYFWAYQCSTKGAAKKGKGWGVASSRWHFPLNGNVSNFNTKWLAEGRLGQMQCLVCFSSIAIALTSDTWTHTQFHTHSEKDICIKYKKKNPGITFIWQQFSFPFHCTKCSRPPVTKFSFNPCEWNIFAGKNKQNVIYWKLL